MATGSSDKDDNSVILRRLIFRLVASLSLSRREQAENTLTLHPPEMRKASDSILFVIRR